MSEHRPDACPGEILEWIAWYPDGGLTPEQRGAVEAHAATCPACREEIAVLAGRCEPPVGPEDPERLFERVLALVEAEGLAGATAGAADRGGAVASAAALPLASAFAGARPRPRAVRASAGWGRLARAAAAAAVLLALGGLAGWLGRDVAGPGQRPPVYETASAVEPAGEAPRSAAAGAAPVLDVVFRSDATAERIQTALRGLGADIVAGPTPLGRYRVELPAGADARAAAALLRAEGTGVASYAEPLEP